MSIDRLKDEFLLVEVKGTLKEMGRQHGEAVREIFNHWVENTLSNLYKNKRKRFIPENLRKKIHYYMGYYKRLAPDYLDELKGIAEGANSTLENILLRHVIWEIEGCTSFAISSEKSSTGAVFFGQNKDGNPTNMHFGIILKKKPTKGLASIHFTYAGLGQGPGLGEVGLSVAENSLYSNWKPGMPHHLMKHIVYESASTEEAKTKIADLSIRGEMGFNGNFLFADRKSIIDVEIIQGNPRLLFPQNGYLVHGNHLLRQEFRQWEGGNDTFLIDSHSRVKIFNRELECHSKISSDIAKSVLRSHEGRPGSICRHTENTKTFLSILCYPEEQRIEILHGSPCKNKYKSYSI